MFWSRFIELCNKAGKSPNAVAAACGVKSSGTVTGWSKGSIPRTPVLHKMADYFHVTTDYLLGKVDLPFMFKNEKGHFDIDLYALTETEKPTPKDGDGLDPELVALIKRIPADRMPEVERYLRFQAGQEEKS